MLRSKRRRTNKRSVHITLDDGVIKALEDKAESEGYESLSNKIEDLARDDLKMPVQVKQEMKKDVGYKPLGVKSVAHISIDAGLLISIESKVRNTSKYFETLAMKDMIRKTDVRTFKCKKCEEIIENPVRYRDDGKWEMTENRRNHIRSAHPEINVTPVDSDTFKVAHWFDEIEE